MNYLPQVDPGIFAAHLVPNGWEITAPSSDPYLPAYWCVAVLMGAGHDGTHDALADHPAPTDRQRG